MNIQQVLSELRNQRSRLDQAIAALESFAPMRGQLPNNSLTPRKTRTMSLAARQRIAKAKKAWWAKQKRKTAPTKAARKRRHISAAARKRLSQIMKKRWAERKKAAAQ